MLGGLTALSAVVSAVSTRLYPLLLARLGLNNTGLLGFTLEAACITLCLASVWAPGSPFSLSPQPQPENSSYVSVVLLLSGPQTARL